MTNDRMPHSHMADGMHCNTLIIRHPVHTFCSPNLKQKGRLITSPKKHLSFMTWGKAFKARLMCNVILVSVLLAIFHLCLRAICFSAACNFLITAHFPSTSPLCLFSPVSRPLLQLLEYFFIDRFYLGHHGFSALWFDHDGHNAAHVHQLFLTSPHPSVQLSSAGRVPLQRPLLRHREAQQARQDLIGQLHVQVTSTIRYRSADAPNTAVAAQFPQEGHNECFDTDLCGAGVRFGHHLF